MALRLTEPTTPPRVSPEIVDEITHLLGQQASRERDMAHAFRVIGRVVIARHHESRTGGFEDAAVWLRERLL
jgi:hypothetical protein